MDANERLDDIISNGLHVDIFEAEQSIAIDWLIGCHAKEVNESTFGEFFGSLQIICGRYSILAVNRLFETPSNRYSIRSIPAAIDLMKSERQALHLPRKLAVIDKLIEFGCNALRLEGLEDPQITELIATEFEKRLPQITLSDSLSRALGALKTARDKSIAHHESIKIADLPKATYADMDKLLKYAKEFVSTIGIAYLSLDAKAAARSMKRLMSKAGIVPSSRQ